jgi:hypothetical protein
MGRSRKLHTGYKWAGGDPPARMPDNPLNRLNRLVNLYRPVLAAFRGMFINTLGSSMAAVPDDLCQ